MVEPRTAVTIDSTLWGVTLDLFQRLVVAMPDNTFLVEDKENGWTDDGLAIYPLAVMTFEAHFNAALFKKVPLTDQSPRLSRKLEVRRDDLARMELRQRTVELTQLACGRTFDKGRKPFQDFSSLVRIRNAIVHHQMYDAPLKEVDQLSQREIAWPEQIPNCGSWTWTQRIATVKGMQWAINTVAAMTAELAQLLGCKLVIPLHGITDAQVRKVLRRRKKK